MTFFPAIAEKLAAPQRSLPILLHRHRILPRRRPSSQPRGHRPRHHHRSAQRPQARRRNIHLHRPVKALWVDHVHQHDRHGQAQQHAGDGTNARPCRAFSGHAGHAEHADADADGHGLLRRAALRVRLCSTAMSVPSAGHRARSLLRVSPVRHW